MNLDPMKIIDDILLGFLTLTVIGLLIFIHYQSEEIDKLNKRVDEVTEALDKLDKLLLGDNSHRGLIQ